MSTVQEKNMKDNKTTSTGEVMKQRTTTNRRMSTTSDVAMTDRPVAKRRRKTFSCTSCRKLKTRCDFEPIAGKCHRCNVLKMDCSLTTERADEISMSIAEAQSDEKTEDISTDDRLSRVEGQLKEVLGILNTLIGSKDKQENDEDDYAANPDYKIFEMLNVQKSNYLDNSTFNAPLNVISRIDARLFKRIDSYSVLKQSCQEFMKFYGEHKALCLELSKSFLTTAHFWIVPGGLKEINEEYVVKHPFITAVFVLLAMCFDENFQYVEEQEKLYWIVRRIMGTALTTTPLTDHDIEAMLYMSLYNIARKPRQPPLDGWITSGMAIKHLMMCINFTAIKNRCDKRDYRTADIFHLRIWNSLCACHLQYTTGTGRPYVIGKDYFDLCELTVEYPMSNIEDNVKLAEINISKLVYKLFHQKDLFVQLIKRNDILVLENGSQIFLFVELREWLLQWEELIHSDTSGVLMFSYEFYHIILSRRFISSFGKYFLQDVKIDTYLEIAHQTACHYSFAVLNRFLALPSSLVRGTPTVALDQIVYSCFTLHDFLPKMKEQIRHRTLGLISKIYWHLNHIGEKKNDATDTVGKIIRSLVEGYDKTVFLQEDQFQQYQPLHDEISSDFTTNTTSNTSSTIPPTSALRSTDTQAMPDVGKFDTFEDFFKNMFNEGLNYGVLP